MTHTPASSSVASPEDQANRERQRKLQRFFIVFAVIEGIVLGTAVILIYVLDVIDPAIGIWVLLGIALVGGTVLTTYMLNALQPNRREQAKGSGLP